MQLSCIFTTERTHESCRFFSEEPWSLRVNASIFVVLLLSRCCAAMHIIAFPIPLILGSLTAYRAEFLKENAAFLYLKVFHPIKHPEATYQQLLHNYCGTTAIMLLHNLALHSLIRFQSLFT